MAHRALKTVTNEAVVTTGVTLQLLSGSTAIMDASNTGTMPITGLLSSRRKKIAPCRRVLSSYSPAVAAP